MILTGRATCQSVVPWIREDAEQREVRLVQYKPVKHPNIQNKTEDKRQGGNTHCGEEWHRQWGRDRSNTMKERRSNSQERVTGWSSRGKAERNKEEREQHAETQRVRETKAATGAEEVELIGNFTTWLSSAVKFNSLYHSVGEFTWETISHSQREHFPLKLEHLPSFVTQRSSDVTSQQPTPPQKSHNVLLHRRPKSKTFYFWTWVRKVSEWCVYWILKGEHTGHRWHQNKESRLFILLVHENNTSREKRKKKALIIKFTLITHYSRLYSLSPLLLLIFFFVTGAH